MTILVIASCCRLTRRKRVDVIIDAIAMMRSPKVTLLLIGNGPESDNLKAQAHRLGVNLVIAGFVGQRVVAKLLSVTDVFTLLSEYDASPKALNEAMNFPVPMIVSDGVGTSRDLVHHGLNGYIFSDGDENALVSYLDRMAEDPETRLAMGAENAAIISDYAFDVDAWNLMRAIEGDG